MKKFIFAIVLVFYVALSYGQNTRRSCSSDVDCGQNNFCNSSNYCECSVGYKQDKNTHNCVTVLGTDCNSKEECKNYPGADCENRKCVCITGQIAGSKECLSVGNRDDPCTYAAECVQRFGQSDNVECKNKMCVCKAGLHFTESETEKRCVADRNLADPCKSNDECILLVNEKNSLECKEGVCQCKSGYTQSEDTCDGSATLITSFLSIIIVAFSIMKL